MYNDRPIEDPRLQAALNDCRRVLDRYGFAGAVMIVAPNEGAYFYKVDAAWSAFRKDDSSLGWRLYAKSREDGKAITRRRIEGAVHTVCQLSDFGAQTMDWMEQIKLIIRDAGIDFDHVPFGGLALPSIVLQRPGDE